MSRPRSCRIMRRTYGTSGPLKTERKWRETEVCPIWRTSGSGHYEAEAVGGRACLSSFGPVKLRKFFLAFVAGAGVKDVSNKHRTTAQNMSSMSNPIGPMQSPQRLRAQAIAALVPFLADGSDSNEDTARLAAAALLDDYEVGTPKELQLSTQIIANGWAAMACLRTAMAAKNLSLDQMLQLQDHAIALDRTSQKWTKILEARRKERAKHPKSMTVENTKWDEGAFQLAINPALERLMDANEKLAVYMDTLASPVAKQPKLPVVPAEQMTRPASARRARR